MPKLTRKSAKLFAENATAAAGGIAQFGSLAAGTPNYSTDPDVIQQLSQYSDGWSAAVLGTKSPALEDRNALDYLLSYQQAYIMQHGVPEWLSTEIYYENSYVVDGNGELRVSTIDNNTGHDPTQDNGGAYWGYAGARGSGKQVGEVYFSQSSDANDNKGALPLFTGELISNANQIYPQFYAWVLAHPGLCTTEAAWQTAITTYGECAKYVIDDTNKTIRLPKLVNYIKMANTVDGITQTAAGLPNITGTFFQSTEDESSLPKDPSGAFYRASEKTGNGVGGSNGYFETIGIDASLSSDVYGNSNTVTPAHTTVFPWVFAFNAAIPASTAQAAQFQQALSSKVDVSSLAQAEVIVETYQNGDSWYRVWSDGWCEQGGTETFASTATRTSTVQLLKPLVSSNYQIFLMGFGSAGAFGIRVSSQDSTSFGYVQISAENNYKGTKVFWKASGYISL